MAKFKRKISINVREVTHFVTKKSLESNPDKLKEIHKFSSLVRQRLFKYGQENVYNTDQYGFQKILVARTTLAIHVTKRIEKKIQNMDAYTHSYTIRPTISANREFLNPLLIFHQEFTGYFGPQVKKSFCRPPNIYMTSSTSGIITKPLMKEWFTKVFFPAAGENSFFLVDSLGTYKDRT